MFLAVVMAVVVVVKVVFATVPLDDFGQTVTSRIVF